MPDDRPTVIVADMNPWACKGCGGKLPAVIYSIYTSKYCSVSCWSADVHPALEAATKFAERLFKMQDWYKSAVDDDVLAFLREVHGGWEGCDIQLIRDRIDAAEKERGG